ncbi:Possible alpha-xyloside ABC transporter, permease component [[Actinomadura] parvosata subsp. kistnae]|uniref:ABC transporter permease n=1 Tax=[Actinomadura] parvosata subsp. kistnae TaxID=1909395 RepID=A0A1V0A1A0_9ACTN|nr:sugar ABC transporter permease [Nonomuraea sp. ATCC 55076]AQZ63970.1 ABC transporter permease [Nonomuraea sp. ATCC 55076]SPL89836.1 Possible alpha-xyloside ABC transporter, permease component [Actinomadura parvosata subsp. kistnae]
MPATSAGRRTRLRAASTPWLFASPAIVLFTLFLVIPIGYAIYLSFRGFRVEGGGAFGRRVQAFVGLDNYTTALSDPEYVAGLGRVLLYGLISIPTVLGLALLFALLLDTPRVRARGFARTAIFLPYAVPGVIASLLWGFLYLPSTSPITYLARQLGAGPLDFFGFPALYFSLANIALWSGVGFNMIIIFTSLRAIPTSVYEAARIDGASELQIAWRIKIPLVAPALVLTGLFSVIGTLQLYSEPATLRPMTTTISSSWVPLMKIYQEAFSNDNLGGAAAASVVLALGILVLSLLLLRFFQRRTFGDNA